MASVIFILALVACAAAVPDYCQFPDEPPEGLMEKLEPCFEEHVNEECISSCAAEELDAVDDDGWLKMKALVDHFIPKDEFEESNAYFTALGEQCVERAKELAGEIDFEECDKANFVIGCIALLLPDECEGITEEVEEELKKRRRK